MHVVFLASKVVTVSVMRTFNLISRIYGKVLTVKVWLQIFSKKVGNKKQQKIYVLKNIKKLTYWKPVLV